MERVHLFELEDFPWVPRAIRDGGTDLLDTGFSRAGFYRGVIPKLIEFLEATGRTNVVDLCSGGGGGAMQAWPTLRARAELEMVLTDRFPNEAGRARVAAAGDPRVTYREAPVDAMAIPRELSGVRTMWGALHHFPPDAVRALITATVRDGEPLAFFDVAASPAIRRMPIVFAPLAMAVNMSVPFLGAMVLMLLVRPVRASNLALTHILPLIPALTAWDGTVSALRAYTPDELLEIAKSVPSGDSYEWSAGAEGSALYITGRPRTK